MEKSWNSVFEFMWEPCITLGQDEELIRFW